MTTTHKFPHQQGENARESLVEGDIEPGNGGMRSGALSDRWDYHMLPYVIDFEKVPQGYRPWVRMKLAYILELEYRHKLGDCIRLCERSSCPAKVRYSPNFVRIRFNNDGCWSSVGMQGWKVLSCSHCQEFSQKPYLAPDWLHKN